MVYIVCFCLNQYCEKVVSYETDFQFSLCELSFREGLSSIGLSRIYSGISLKALKLFSSSIQDYLVAQIS